MARVFIDSFETQSLDLWDTCGSASIVSTIGKDLRGDYCLSPGNNYAQKNMDCTEKYYAFRWRPSTVVSLFVISFRNGAQNLSNIYWDTITHSLNAWEDGVGLIASGLSNTIYIDTSYFIQLYWKFATVGGRIILNIDGINHINFTGDTLCGGSCDRFMLGAYHFYDNMIVDDSEMPADTEICLMKPNGIGTSSNWTPTSGDNYTCVDEVPYSDADYVSEDAADAIDTYAVENSPGDLVSVKCVQVQARARNEVGSLLNNMNLVVRSGADYHGSDESLTNTFVEKTKIWEKNPADSQDWEKADIDAMEIGIRART